MGSYSIRVIVCSHIQWVVCRGLYGVFAGSTRVMVSRRKLKMKWQLGLYNGFYGWCDNVRVTKGP